jgi:hypothetical protein
MKKSYLINREALRRAFREAAASWQSGRSQLSKALVDACEAAVLLQIHLYAGQTKHRKTKTKATKKAS